MSIEASIFKAYDIRGVAPSTLDESVAEGLGWKARRGLDEMMRDAWRWLSMSPDGYR